MYDYDFEILLSRNIIYNFQDQVKRRSMVLRNLIILQITIIQKLNFLHCIQNSPNHDVRKNCNIFSFVCSIGVDAVLPLIL